MKSDAKNISANQPARDDIGPKENYGHAPVIFFFLFAILLFVGALYVDNYSGDFSSKVYAPFKSEAQVADTHPKAPENPQAALGRKIYTTACVPCHQANALGSAGQFPPLAGSEWVNAGSPERMIRIVLNGLTGPVTVKGTDFNNTMVPWRDIYKDEEISAVITFVRGNKEWGNNASPVTPEMVKKVREATADHNGQWTAPDLQQVPEK